MNSANRLSPESDYKPNSGQTRITFLGTGTSHGVPMIGCRCNVCTSDDPRDRRSRCSLFIELPAGNIIIDTTPEFRLQCLQHDVDRVDALLFTHAHADHIFGLDDVRRFCFMQDDIIPCYSSPEVLEKLTRAFSYAFREIDQDYSERPKLTAVPVDGTFDLLGKTVTTLTLCHGVENVLGFRMDRWAYCTDCNRIPSEALAQLKNLDVLILDALRFTPHPTHFNVEQAIAMAQQINAKRTYLTHIAHEIKHSDLESQLPDGISLSYDGLELTI
jgi:phosphoribosyl 1,2-cyclic phosphate phosphodiesterase